MDDLEFLKDLQKRLREQETDSQANPRYWVVAQYEWTPCWEEQMDDYHYCDDETCYESFELFLAHLKEMYPEEDLSDVTDFFDLELEHEDILDGYNRIPMKKIQVLQRGTFFLTKEECQNHIKRNHYHYNDTVHTYALTAWRSPEFERLMTILETFDFDNLKKRDE